jgi:Protein of unknown function DUF262
MAGPAYVQEPTVQYLHQVLDELARGYLQIPQFQRGFVWSDEQRLELLRSIQSGIPIGSVLVWRTELTSLRSVTSIGPHQLPTKPPTAVGLRSYLLDGLQRLSTLYGCLRPLAPGADPSFHGQDGEETSWRVAYDLRDEDFEILERDQVPQPTQLLLPLLLDSVGLLRFQRTLGVLDDATTLIERSDALAETFRTYKLPVVPLVTSDLATATRTFVRINRQGTAMSELHMVRALTWTDAFDLVEELEAVSERLHSKLRWGLLAPEWILKVCKALCGLHLDTENPEATARTLKSSPGLLAQAEEALTRAIEWLREVAGIPGLAVLPYEMQLLMIAMAIPELGPVPTSYKQMSPVASRRLYAWFWDTTYTERFSGISGYQMRAMLDGVRLLGQGETWTPKGRQKAPNFELPPKLFTTLARNRTAAVRLAALQPLDHRGARIDAPEQLEAQGVAALAPLSPSLKTLAGRIFVPRHGAEQLLARLLSDVHSLPQKVLDSHAIDEDSASALVNGDLEKFEQARAKALARLEEAFYREARAALEFEHDEA